jgi:hypothetical protein
MEQRLDATYLKHDPIEGAAAMALVAAGSVSEFSLLLGEFPCYGTSRHPKSWSSRRSHSW